MQTSPAPDAEEEAFVFTRTLFRPVPCMECGDTLIVETRDMTPEGECFNGWLHCRRCRLSYCFLDCE